MSQIACPHCAHPIDVPEATADELIRCDGCGCDAFVPAAGGEKTRQVVSSAALTLPPLPTHGETAGCVPSGYEIIEEMGRGGMGVVYKARQVALGRIVALKMLLHGAHGEPELFARFRAEAETLGRLKHPGIVTIHEVGEVAGLPFLSMEFCEGGDLTRKLNGTPLPPRDAAALVRSLAEAVQAAHEARVLHRDLKPANVLLTGDGALKITDFGLAKRLDEQGRTQTGAVMGTPSYMAPEQARGDKDVGPAADVYALGAILYECLTGRPPFKAATVAETLMQVMSEEPPAPRSLNAAVPRELEIICLKCLEKEVSKRFSSARELCEDLERWLTGQPILARPVGPLTRAVKWVRRNPAVATLSASVLMVFALGATAATVFGFVANEKARQASWQEGEKDRALLEAREETKKVNEARANEKKARDKAEENEKKAKKASDEAEEKKAMAETGRHGFMMTAALQAWRQHDVLLAETILDGASRDFQQTWEYRHVRQLCRRKAMTLRGHTAYVTAVAYSPDGSRIASGGLEGTVRVWDSKSGQELFKGRSASVTAVAYSPDGSRIATSCRDRTVKVWDSKSGQELFSLRGHSDSVRAVAYSPDGSRIASGSADRTVKVWDSRSGQELFSVNGHSGGVNAVTFSPDGSRIASGSFDRTVKVWGSKSGQELISLQGHTLTVMAVAYSPDGSRIASGSTDRTVKVWDSKTRQELFSLNGHSDSVTSVAYSPDGSRIASGSDDHTVKVWDSNSGRQLCSFQGHTGVVRAVAYSPDGSRIVSGSYDKTMKVWDSKSGQELFSIMGHSGGVHAVAYSPDGLRIASSSTDRTVKVWDSKSGQELFSLRGHSDSVRAVAYSLDGLRIASGSADRTVKVWDSRSGQELFSLKGHFDSVNAVAYSPDGSRIASGSRDRTVKVWDSRSGQELFSIKGHSDSVNAVAYSPDGLRIASRSQDRTVKVWDSKSGQELFTLHGHTLRVTGLAYSPDGSRIVSGSADGTVKVWDSKSGQELFCLKGPSEIVTSIGVAFSPDGSRIFGRASGGKHFAWDSKTGKLLPDPPKTMPPAQGYIAVHGNHRAFADGKVIRVERYLREEDWQRWQLDEGHIDAIPRARCDREMYRDEIVAALNRKDAFAAVFHLDRLLALSPEQRPDLLKRRATTLLDALKSNPDDHWAARTLARQAVAAPATIPGLKSLLLFLSRNQHAPQDRLYGALLLRTSKPRDAAIVLRAALRHRPPNTPPIDELLLAIACAKLNRRDEARKHLRTAIAWMDRADQLLRATSLVGHASGDPFVALGALAHTPPDPRLNALDPFTGHELRTLRAEVEKALQQR
jgi:WD40 repeat protein